MVDKPCRSVVKAISYRLIGTFTTILVSFIFSKRLEVAITIGFADLFTKIAIFYWHERIWERIKFGRIDDEADYQI